MRFKTKLFIIALCVTLIICSAVFKEKDEEIALANKNLIRLHVIANSDSPEDQALKLKVRDGLLDRYSETLKAIDPVKAARDMIRENSNEIRRLALEIIKCNGYDYDVKVELGTYSFPTKMYGKNIYPAGEYEALRIIIGRGEGANWWCVMFPPLCFVDASSSVAKEQKVQEKDKLESEEETESPVNNEETDGDNGGNGSDDQVTEVKNTFILVKWWNKLVEAIKNLFS